MSAPNNQFNLNQVTISWVSSSGDGVQPLIEPQPMDILCGKSKRCVDHGGSRRFRTVIEAFREKYQQALTKWDKTSVTREIYDFLSQSGSRFLKQNDALKIWEEISPMAARDKIGHALRFANRVTRRKRGASCIGETAALPTLPEPSTAQPQPQPLVILGVPSLACPSQPLHLQLPPLASVLTPQMASILTPQSPPKQPQVVKQLQPLGCIATAASQPQTESTLSRPSVVQAQGQGLLTQSVLPLNRSQGWYQTEVTGTLKEKAAGKPAPASLEDSFISLLDDVFPMNQSAQALASSAPKDDLVLDFDFDAEILSVLF